jgi:uncharacterized protein YndB with AHSA1/START domain
MKKLLVILVVAVLAFVVALYGYGIAQPLDHLASARARFAASPAEVWAVLADFEAYPQWNPNFEAIRRTDDVDGKPCWIYDGDFGPMPTVIDVFEAPTRLVTRIAPDADIGFQGTWTYDLSPAGDGGCTLTLVEAGSVQSGLMRGMGALLFGYHDSMVDFLTDLGAHFDEAVVPELVPTTGDG